MSKPISIFIDAMRETPKAYLAPVYAFIEAVKVNINNDRTGTTIKFNTAPNFIRAKNGIRNKRKIER